MQTFKEARQDLYEIFPIEESETTNETISKSKANLKSKLNKITKPFVIAESTIDDAIKSAAESQAEKLLESAQASIQKIQEIELRSTQSESNISKINSILSSTLARQESEFQSAIANQSRETQKKIDDLVLSAISKSEEQTKELSDRINVKIQQESEKLSNIVTTELEPSKERANQYLLEIETLKNNTEELIGKITSTASTKHYQDAYRWEMATRVLWQILSLAGFIAIIYAIQQTATQLATNSSGELSSHDIFAFSIRATSIFMAIFFISFCAKQASKHHELEKFNRQMRFELLTLDTYLSTLSDRSEREKAKLQLKENFFGQSQKIMSSTSTSNEPELSTGHIKELIETLSKLVKSS